MKAIQSLWTKPWEENKCGWLSLEDLLASQELSVIHLRKCNQFEKIVFYTDGKGFELTKPLHKYYDEVIVNLDDINWVESFNWAFQKLFIYNQQNEAFVHIDSDVYLWDGLPQHWIDGKVEYFFQNQEVIERHKFYKTAVNEVRNCISDAFFPKMPLYAINCGVAGFNDLSIISRYYENALLFIENNQQHDWIEHRERYHQCVLFEQLFLVHLIEGKNIAYILDSYFKEVSGIRYTHLIAAAKRSENNIRMVRRKLEFVKARMAHAKVLQH